jgi:hypothetical protein
VRALLFKGFVVAALIVVVAVPAASARSGVRVRLSVLPLPASSLGSAAKSLPLQLDSGVLTNKGLVNRFYFGAGLPVTPNRSFAPTGIVPRKLGRISGYVLDYGLGASGGAGVTEVWTSVDEYKSSADARKALAFWQRGARGVGQWVGGGLSVRIKKEAVAAVGSGRFAFFVGYSDKNIAPLFGLDEQFTRGRYEADVSVWAGSAAAAKQLAPRLAKKLDARIRQALAGRLHANPVKPPANPKPGPPPGGPDLAPLQLKTADLGGGATDVIQGYMPLYFSPRGAVSGYYVNMGPAGPFFQLEQWIDWYPTANQASFTADVEAAPFGKYSLDLSSLGDGARGALANGSNPSVPSVAVLVFSSGRLEERVDFLSHSAIQPSQVKSIAQTIANYINAAGLGS